MNRRRRGWIFLGVALAVAVAGYLGYRRSTAASQSDATSLQTGTVERGTLVASIISAGTIAVPQSATLSWKTTGVVGTVHVAVGDAVKAGDLLMELDLASLDPSMIQAQVDLASAEQALADLLAGPTSLQLAQAELQVAQARQALREAEYRRRVQQEGSRASSDTIAAAQANLVLAESEVARAQAIYNGLSGSPEDDPGRALALSNLVATRKKRDSILRNLNWYKGHPTDDQQAVLDAELAVAKADLAQAEQDLAQLRAGPDEADVAAAQARVAAAQATVDLARLTAPFDATVVAVGTQAGDSVSNNTLALALADVSRFEVQVDVSELDVNRIVVGQEATLTLDAVPDQTFVGRVAEVAFLGSVNQGVVTYPVTVVIDRPDASLKPGMTAAVSIATDLREGVLLVPNRAVFVSGGARTVVVLFEGQQISVPVVLGLVGDTTSEVAEGTLREGDVVVINSSTGTTGSFVPGFGGGFFGSGGSGGGR